MTAFQKQKLPRLFALHDLDQDGVVTRADSEEYAKRIASTRTADPTPPSSGSVVQLRA